MIALNDLAKDLETKLNKTTTTGLKFNIVSDTGDFKYSEREKNNVAQYINGVMLESSSQITTLNNGNIVATLNANLRLLIDLNDEEKDETITYSNGKKITVLGYENQIKSVREILVSILQDNEPKVVSDKNGKSFTISTIYQLPTSGVRGMEQVVGDCYTFNLFILYIIIENGINSRQAVYTLDGLVIPYQAKTATRTPILDGFVFANTKDGSTKNLASMSSFSVTLELPALTDEVTQIIFDNVFNGALNQAHILNVKIGNIDKYYLVRFAESREIGTTMENVGQSITLMEAPMDYDLVSFSNKYVHYDPTQDWKYRCTKRGAYVDFYNGVVGMAEVGDIFTVKAYENFVSLGEFEGVVE